MSAEDSPGPDARSLPQRVGLGTWPKKIGAAVLGAVVASGVSYFIGADFWKGVEKKIGIAGAPVAITTLTDVDSFKSDVVHVPEFVLNRPINQVPPPPNGDLPDGRYAWAHQLGGVDATESLFRFSVVGKESEPVLLQGLRVKLVDRRPPLKGSLITFSGLGAPQSVRYIQVDLSKDPPTWDYIGPKGKPEEHFPLRVSSSEPEVFDVSGVSLRGDVTWYLQLDYTADGEQKSIRIDDHGKPFRTTESRAPGQNAYAWMNGRWELLPTP
jgi:hypothetical protein